MKKLSNKQQIQGFLFWLGMCFVVAATGAIASVQAKSFYTQLTQPTWAPPASVFGPVWSMLYVMMAVSAWLVWRRGGFRQHKEALSIFVIQLAMNGLWSWLFFAWHLGQLAFIDILVLWCFIVMNMIAFWRCHKIAALLLVPYFLWVSFAACLNYSIWQLNPVILS